MLIAALLVILILFILFRDEIRELLGFLFAFGLLWWLWNAGWWGKVIAVVLALGFIVGKVGTWLEGRQQAASGSAFAAGGGDGWYYMDGDALRGPVSDEQLLAMVRSGRLSEHTPIRWGRGGKWMTPRSFWGSQLDR